jgi:hypothetical protein
MTYALFTTLSNSVNYAAMQPYFCHGKTAVFSLSHPLGETKSTTRNSGARNDPGTKGYILESNVTTRHDQQGGAANVYILNKIVRLGLL